MFAGGEPESDEQVGLAGAGVLEQHDGFAGVHVVPGGELAEGGGGDRGDGVDVELREPLEPGELGVGDAAGPAAFGAVVDLGGEDLSEVTEVGLPLPQRDVGQPGSFGADRGQVQLPGGRADRRLRRGVDGARGTVPAVAGRRGGGGGSLPVSRVS